MTVESNNRLPEYSDECLALRFASAKTVAAVERLARSDRRLAATVGAWDADMGKLNTSKVTT